MLGIAIGIIGIALILSLSTGFKNYIDKIQEDTLTSYPLTVTAETADTMSALLTMASQTGEGDGTDVVKERQYMSTMFSKIGKILPSFLRSTAPSSTIARESSARLVASLKSVIIIYSLILMVLYHLKSAFILLK